MENVRDDIAEYHPLTPFHQRLESILGFAACLELQAPCRYFEAQNIVDTDPFLLSLPSGDSSLSLTSLCRNCRYKEYLHVARRNHQL